MSLTLALMAVSFLAGNVPAAMWGAHRIEALEARLAATEEKARTPDLPAEAERFDAGLAESLGYLTNETSPRPSSVEAGEGRSLPPHKVTGPTPEKASPAVSMGIDGRGDGVTSGAGRARSDGPLSTSAPHASAGNIPLPVEEVTPGSKCFPASTANLDWADHNGPADRGECS